MKSHDEIAAICRRFLRYYNDNWLEESEEIIVKLHDATRPSEEPKTLGIAVSEKINARARLSG